jgi:hypothetical protein
MPPQINLQELYSMQKKKLQNRRKCFDHIIELCHRRIRTVSSYCGQNTFYEIPGFLVGYPLYNLNECIEYVVEALRKNGFLIQILPPPQIGVIYISWDPRELRPQKAIAPPPPVSINGYNSTNLNNPNLKKVKTPIGYREQMNLF